MNRQSLLSLPLGLKLALAFGVAIFVPIFALALASFNSGTDLVLRDMRAFVSESGSLQEQAIENDFRNALNTVNSYLAAPNNLAILRSPFVTRQERGTGDETRNLDNLVQQSFRNELIVTGLFDAAWLMTPNGAAFSIEGALDSSLPFERLEQATDENLIHIGEVAQDLVNRGIFQALIVVNHDEQPHILAINVVLPDFADEGAPLGYLVTDLNLDIVIIENLASTNEAFDTYSFVLLDTGDYLSTSDVIEADLIDPTSTGVQSVLSTDSRGIKTYEVGAEDQRREVVGFYSSIQLNNIKLFLVLEVNTSIVNEQLYAIASGIGFAVMSGSGLLVLVLVALIYYLVVPPINELLRATRGITRGAFDEPVSSVGRGDEIGVLATAFVDMRHQVRTLTEETNRRLSERNRDVRVTQDISRAITAERDLQSLLNNVVNLIIANFPSIYHAQIFLIDERGEFAVLRASTGKAGRDLLHRGHRLAIGSVSVIGQVAEQGQILIARNTAESDVHRSNEFLGETQAELAIPLQLGERIIGALDVQSKQRDSFDQDQVTTLQTLADQITIAIENARLYEESARLVARMEHERSLATHDTWQHFMTQQRWDELASFSGTDTGYDFSALRQAVIQGEQSVVGEPTERETIPFVVPIRLRGVVLGVAEYEVRQAEFTYDKVLLAEEMVNRLAFSLDNARLFRDSMQATERERIVNDISTQLTGQTDIQAILRSAVREVGLALGTPQVSIRLQQSNGEDAEEDHQSSDLGESQPGNPSNGNH